MDEEIEFCSEFNLLEMHLDAYLDFAHQLLTDYSEVDSSVVGATGFPVDGEWRYFCAQTGKEKSLELVAIICNSAENAFALTADINATKNVALVSDLAIEMMTVGDCAARLGFEGDHAYLIGKNKLLKSAEGGFNSRSLDTEQEEIVIAKIREKFVDNVSFFAACERVAADLKEDERFTRKPSYKTLERVWKKQLAAGLDNSI